MDDKTDRYFHPLTAVAIALALGVVVNIGTIMSWVSLWR